MKLISSVLAERLLYSLRRSRFRLFNQEQFQKFDQLRKGLSAEGYTLKPFDELGCIFIHVPKCAGQSIRRTLFANLQPGHIRAYTYQLIYPWRQYQQYFKFAFVRNPWDRVVSAYLFMKEGGAHTKDLMWAKENLSEFNSFESFIKDGLSRRSILDWPHFQPQANFLRGQSGRIEMDFIGRFENIQDDFELVRKELGSPEKLAYVNKTRSKKEGYRSYYKDEIQQIVAEVYSEDIKTFGYDF